MLKNKEIKTLILTEILVAVLSIFGFIMLNNCIYSIYKKELINNNAYIVNSIIEKHTELEDEVINSLLHNDLKYKDSKKIIEKYGLTDIESLDFINNNVDKRKQILYITIIYVLIIFAIMIAVLQIFINKFYKKIRTLSKYTDDVLNNRYSMDIREYDEGDISNLKNDLYKMTVKLREQTETSIKDKKDLEETLSNISHQLKTPLTSMYVINELLYDNKLKEQERKNFLTKNKNQLERIEWLITSLLKISRLDSGTEVLKLNNTSVNTLIKKSLEPLKIPMELKNISYNVDCPNDIMVNIDINWTSEALINIIKNAYEHTNENGKIDITVTNNPIYTEIKISDNGCGINNDDIGHIFERFYRGKSNNKESIGIGLNMAKKIINLEHGDIEVKSKVNVGTTFYIKFYKTII